MLAPTIYVITDPALELLCVLEYKEPLENMALVLEVGFLSLLMLQNLNSPAAFRETEVGGGAVVSIALQIGNSGERPKMEHKLMSYTDVTKQRACKHCNALHRCCFVIKTE